MSRADPGLFSGGAPFQMHMKYCEYIFLKNIHQYVKIPESS